MIKKSQQIMMNLSSFNNKECVNIHVDSYENCEDSNI
jgi:hypothetical protein